MAFSDFTCEVKVQSDTQEMFDWTAETCQIGTWGKKIGLVGRSATYCFQYEHDALLFMLKWGTR